jgi:hypothetical protein
MLCEMPARGLARPSAERRVAAHERGTIAD